VNRFKLTSPGRKHSLDPKPKCSNACGGESKPDGLGRSPVATQIDRLAKPQRKKTQTMKRISSIALTALMALMGRQAGAELALTLTVSAKAAIQQDSTDVGDVTTTPSPQAVKVDTKSILERLASDLNTSFPAGSKLVLAVDAGGIAVVDNAGQLLADVSDIMQFDVGDESSQVSSGKSDHAKGARSEKALLIGTLHFDDGSIEFSLRGLVTATSTDTAYKQDTSGNMTQSQAISGSMKGGAGTGHDDTGAVGIISGGMAAKGKATVIAN